METSIEEPEIKTMEEDQAKQIVDEQKPIYLSKYGAYLPPFNPQAVIAALDSLLEGDEEEQRETLAILKQALQESASAKRPSASGLRLKNISVEEAAKLLQELDEFDVAEQRETLAYLKHALDEDRLSDRKLFSL